jgi:hypothetical protein
MVASWPKTSTSIASTSRSDSPRTQQEITSVSSAFVRLTLWPNSWSHSAAMRVAQLGALQLHRPGCGLQRAGLLPAVAVALR